VTDDKRLDYPQSLQVSAELLPVGQSVIRIGSIEIMME
jgi:hypothetical protein